jgi:glycerophosphoryl diester phosphodiesterase
MTAVWNIAHRGASGYAPENTRAAFDLAIAMGATAIETDLRMTVDGAIVLFHDATADRVTDGRGPTDDYTLAELRELTVRGPADYAGDRQGLVTLDELLDDYAERMPLVLEIKDARVTKPLVRALEERGLVERAVVTSFLWYPLLEARQQSPRVQLGYLTATFDDDILHRVRRRDFQQVCPHVSQLAVSRVECAHQHGLKVRAWGIDQRFQIDRLYETGADGATVNWPDWIADQVTQAS